MALASQLVDPGPIAEDKDTADVAGFDNAFACGGNAGIAVGSSW